MSDLCRLCARPSCSCTDEDLAHFDRATAKLRETLSQTIDLAGERTEQLVELLEILQTFLARYYFENLTGTILECHWCGIGIYEQFVAHPDNWKLLAHDKDCPCLKAVMFLRKIGHWPEWQP